MAKPTIEKCINEARVILQDEVPPYRYTEDQLLDSFNYSLYELKRLRPDIFLGQYGVDLPIYTPTELTTEIPFPGIFFLPVVSFIAGYAELRDDEFAIDNRAVVLVRSFARLTAPTESGLI